ncbi:NCR1 [[Candida] subhashii]|uniref:NCR1 n=1 Tax=[Candida] subhashii TaxID=561895 RepID=A0A8J5UVC5_9ASCO|nr:NCR1 [[Candida] subhashii]KAG7662150.1 NCR1 [[Candida] subhashii]
MRLIGLLIFLFDISWVLAISPQHKPGYCNTYGNCGKKSVFGSQLPCSNFVEATKPTKESQTKLKAICGEEFELVCCSPEQIDALESNLKRVDPIISTCPACRKNFYDFFCKFTCSPNESTFINVTKTQIARDTGKEIVTEIDQYVNPEMAQKFFDSCKNVKFSATNGFAMDLIGGGAKDYKQFLKFLGDEKPLLGGSPYQINFVYETTKEELDSGIILRNDHLRNCDDKEYKCACTDCTSSCPKLPHASRLDKKCMVGLLPCFSFAIAIIWLCMIVVLGGYHVYLVRSKPVRHLSYGGLEEEDEIDNMISPMTYVTVRKPSVTAFSNRLKYKIQEIFQNIGYFCVKYPGVTIGTSILLSLMLSSGLFRLDLETNPVNLWVSPHEPAFKNQQYFESNFGEWYRIEQVIVSSKDDGPILNWEIVKWWFEKESELEQLNPNVLLSDICFKPLEETCAIESFTQYFNGDINSITEDTWKAKLQNCMDSPVNCLPSFQQPLKPHILFDNDDISKVKAFTVTVLVNSNSGDETFSNKSIEFEHSFQKWAQVLQDEHPELNIAFSTEISLTEELNKSTNTDIRIIIISYLLMFLYSSLALGGKLPHRSWHSLVKTRFMLGLCGILIILLSVSASVGFFSLIGLKSTLIIAEVIPFLVLAIGVDNIFLIVHELHLTTEHFPDLPLEDRISQALGCIGPSCFLSAILQVSMFLLATFVDMPAVKNFAYYSAGAVAINFMLQMTCFVGLLALDQRRLEDNRVDCMPWITIAPVQLNADHILQEDSDMDEQGIKHLEYNFSHWVSQYYAPVILKKTMKPKIITLFVIWLGISLSLFPQIKLGLDQRIAIPKDSYLINYFNSVYDYFNAGPPTFFVVKDLDLTTRENQQKICGRFSGCDKYSLANILEQEFKRSKKSMIAEPTSNWLDDFLTWLNPDLDQCCRFKKGTVFEQPDNVPEFCSPYAPERQCQTCYLNHDPPYDSSMNGFPEGPEFMFYFNQWIQEPSDPCPLGGKAPYGNTISRTSKNIHASYFRTSHTPLKSQQDFINAYKGAVRVVDEIKGFINDLDIFVWSPFYIFFVQYHTIVNLTFELLGAAMIIIWLVSSLLLGSIKSATVMTITVISILINIGGVLAIWDISLNAVSLVNLIICAGLAVEFTIHLTRAYVNSPVSLFENANEESLYSSFLAISSLDELPARHRNLRAYSALSTVGGSIIGGITLTKFIGISVLAFTRSKIFEVYYFRMWFSLIIIAAIHALCILPILLSYFGCDYNPEVRVEDESQLSANYNNQVDEDEEIDINQSDRS